VDAIVVYKLDRLSRSLLDFSKIMETLDRERVAFVSVTEAFNTKTSMGRMVLNVLASFAQFEREQISDRTRDKMSAARRRGKWVGGTPILGYDVAPGGGRIVVNPAEAEHVRGIFGLYLDTGSTAETLREAQRRGWTRKRWVTRNGQERGGEPFDKARLLYILKNQVYAGRVAYDGVVYPGEHEAIVDADAWRRVQELIRRNGATSGGAFRNRNQALLKGILRCAPCDRAMTHAWSGRKGKRYQYYVCTRAQKEGWAACPTKSVPAAEIERFVVEQLQAIGSDPALAAQVLAETRAAEDARAAGLRKDLAVVRREAGRLARAIQRLLGRKGAGTADGARLTELHDQVRAAEERARVLEAEIEALEVGRIPDGAISTPSTMIRTLRKGASSWAESLGGGG
jgi:site-specific DNA recombinase